MTPDPFGGVANQPISLNKYLYADANPIMNLDPSGMFSVTLGLTGIGILLSSLESFLPSASLGHGGGSTSTSTSSGGRIPNPGWWSLIPVVGSGWEALYNFQEGNIGLGLFWSAMAISDVFLVKALATSAIRALGKVALTEGAEVVFTRVPGEAIPRIASSGTYIARTEGAVYGMTTKTAPIWRTLSTKATGTGTITWTGPASELFARHPVSGWYSGLKNLLGQYKSIRIGDIRLFGFTKTGNDIVVWSAQIIPKAGWEAIEANAKVIGRVVGIDYAAPRAVEQGMEEFLDD